MKLPIWVTALIIAAIAVPGWYGQRRISALRSDRDQLAARCAAAGVLVDPADIAARPTKRPRPDRAAAVRRLVVDLVANSPESEMSLGSLDEAARQDMADRMDRVLFLGKDELKVLISELRANGAGYETLIYFAVTRLSADAPREALDLLTDSPEMQELVKKNYNGITANPIFEAVRNWAETDPAAALEWVRGHREFSKYGEAELALIFAAAGQNSASAIALVREFHSEPTKIAEALARYAEPERRQAFLTFLRQWQAQAVEGELPEKCFDSSMRQLVLENSTFESASGWIEDEKLSLTEIETLTRNIDGQLKNGDEAKWMTWLAGHLPEGKALNPISEIAESWTNKDPVAAAAWIAEAPAGSVKTTAERAYTETIFPYKPAEAIRRTLALPDDEDRQWTLRKFHREWPENDPAGKAAFAKEHGIE